jgi:hypothetical protein
VTHPDHSEALERMKAAASCCHTDSCGVCPYGAPNGRRCFASLDEDAATVGAALTRAEAECAKKDAALRWLADVTAQLDALAAQHGGKPHYGRSAQHFIERAETEALRIVTEYPAMDPEHEAQHVAAFNEIAAPWDEATPETCKTCGSDDPKVRGHRHYRSRDWHLHGPMVNHGDVTDCPDSFHTPTGGDHE